MSKTHSTSALNTDAVETGAECCYSCNRGVGRLLVASVGPLGVATVGPLGVAETVSAGQWPY